MKGIITGILNVKSVVIQTKGENREIVKCKELFIEDECFDITGKSPKEIDELIPVIPEPKDDSNDFDRFKARLIQKVEAEVINNMGLN